MINLLPRNKDLGWTPYAWFVYLPTFFIEPVSRGASMWVWIATIVATLLFVVSYLRGYWLCGWQLLPVIVLQVLIAIVFTPINFGAVVFFIYAASFCGQLDRPKDAVRMILGILAIGATMAWLFHTPAFYWLSAIVLAPLIGGVNLHFAQVRRASKLLQRSREEVERMAAVAERERIARDLHDVLGHTLSLIVLKSELASKLADRDPARAAREIRDVEEVARTALREVREAISGVRAATLDDEIARGRALLHAAGVRAEFAISVMPMERAKEEALALALRETLTNVARHSGAGVCKVRIAHSGEACVVDIEDDGRGGIAPEGNGLRGMRERIESLGGTVARIASRGMRLAISMPLAEPRPLRDHA